MRTLMSYTEDVTGREFIRRIALIGRKHRVGVRLESKRGKGSHITLHYGSRKTVVKDRRKEIGPGLLSRMIRDLGLKSNDLR